MSKRLIDYDPYTRSSTWHEYDHTTGKTHIETTQDVQPIIERNKRLMNTPGYASGGKKNDYFHIATIPNNILYKWMVEEGIDWTKKEDLPKIEKKLMSNEWKYLRTCDRI